jgi:phenylacetate-coenzyme A ligase PaaK-like adenylate-forming protein
MNNTLYLLYELLAALRRKSWSASWLAEYQGVRLREIVRHAYEAVSYYLELFDKAGVRPDEIRSLADLSFLPITTTATLQNLPTEAILARGLDPSAFVKERTRGSTGRPFTIQHTQSDRTRKSAIYMRTYLQVGLRLTDQQMPVSSRSVANTHTVVGCGALRPFSPRSAAKTDAVVGRGLLSANGHSYRCSIAWTASSINFVACSTIFFLAFPQHCGQKPRR